MRLFTASLATETNTFSPLPVNRQSFKDSFYALPGQHPDTPTLCSAPMVAARKHAEKKNFTLIEGTAAWAEPGGIVNQQAYESLRDEILDQLTCALPVDGVILGLHGAMVAHGYDDCEGDLLSCVRKIVGSKTVISAELDPHSNLTSSMLENSDILIYFKYFPHSDFYERAEELVELTLCTIRGEIQPRFSIFDCCMIDVFPTSREPTRSFVRKLKTMEGKNSILSISFIHGFLAGDVPDLGSKILVVTDNNSEYGDILAKKLGQEAFQLRGRSQPTYLGSKKAVQSALATDKAPVVLADVWDNPGGGVAGDSTFLLKTMLDMGVKNTALASIWDPIAVKLCFAAGEGSKLKLRFGGKTCPEGGAPLDRKVLILKTVHNAFQHFGDSIVTLGDAVAMQCEGVVVILSTNRCQTFGVDIFTNMGVDPLTKKILAVKSTNHFYEAFNQIAQKIIYVETGDMYPHDARRTDYKKLSRPIWPIVENPFG